MKPHRSALRVSSTGSHCLVFGFGLNHPPAAFVNLSELDRSSEKPRAQGLLQITKSPNNSQVDSNKVRIWKASSPNGTERVKVAQGNLSGLSLPGRSPIPQEAFTNLLRQTCSISCCEADHLKHYQLLLSFLSFSPSIRPTCHLHCDVDCTDRPNCLHPSRSILVPPRDKCESPNQRTHKHNLAEVFQRKLQANTSHRQLLAIKEPRRLLPFEVRVHGPSR